MDVGGIVSTYILAFVAIYFMVRLVDVKPIRQFYRINPFATPRVGVKMVVGIVINIGRGVIIIGYALRLVIIPMINHPWLLMVVNTSFRLIITTSIIISSFLMTIPIPVFLISVTASVFVAIFIMYLIYLVVISTTLFTVPISVFSTVSVLSFITPIPTLGIGSEEKGYH